MIRDPEMISYDNSQRTSQGNIVIHHINPNNPCFFGFTAHFCWSGSLAELLTLETYIPLFQVQIIKFLMGSYGLVPSLKLTASLNLKMDGWKTIVSLKGMPSCQVLLLLVSERVYFRLSAILNQGIVGCTPNSVPMVFIMFSRDSWGL